MRLPLRQRGDRAARTAIGEASPRTAGNAPTPRFVVQCGFLYLGSADPVKRSPLESWDASLVEQIEEIAVFERQCAPEHGLFDVEMRVEASQSLDVVVDDEEPGVGV